jgi:spore coat polysaccharide biosynthesis protein SpsF
MTSNESIKVLASIQARMGSSRLPGKVMKDVLNKPLLLRQVNRIKKCKNISQIVIATTTNKNDDAIVEMCKKNDILYYRGSEDDVLGRVASLLEHFNADIHAEFVGDSPLPDIDIIDEFITIFIKERGKIDYLSNCLKTTYPPGLDVILYNSKILVDLNKELDISDPLREHVGYNITRFPEKFRIKSIEAPSKHFQPDLYLEVDNKEDFILIEKIFRHFLSQGIEYFSLDDILCLIERNPKLKKINQDVKRNWKILRGEES